MGRSSSSFVRGKPKFKPQPTVLVVCEDIKSGKTYLQDAAVHFRCNALVEIAHCGNTDPLGIVRHAKKRSGAFDEVYCVIDRDSHQNFKDAIDLAKTLKNVKLIISFPCFEFWLILHFGFSRQPIVASGNNSAGDNAVIALKTKQGMHGYDKSKDKVFEILLDKLGVARKTAPRVLSEANETREMNPSTIMHELIDRFEQLGKLEAVKV